MQEIVHTHIYNSPGCSIGHRYMIKFRNEINGLSWIKVCRRCGKDEMIKGHFNNTGHWVLDSKSHIGESHNELKQVDLRKRLESGPGETPGP